MFGFQIIINYLYILMIDNADFSSERFFLSETEKAFFSGQLTGWYKINQRALPWRLHPEPYKVWLSEIILQQTRVDQGLPYYERFLGVYPTLASLALASEEDVLRLWQGLGYYSRARNMLKAAVQVMKEHGGNFPVTSIELKKLRGIGSYTAAAISSSCFNEPDAVVDGNVYRVLSRYFGIDIPVNTSAGVKFFSSLAQLLLPVDCAGIYNQAIMDFGALQCKPQSPVCQQCVLNSRCVAYLQGQVKKLPVKLAKKKARQRFFNYFVFIQARSTYLVRRPAGDIWQGLFDFPMIETSEGVGFTQLSQEQEFNAWLGSNTFIVNTVVKAYKHVLSHQIIQAEFWELKLSEESVLPAQNFLKIEIDRLDAYAMPRLALKYLETRMDT